MINYLVKLALIVFAASMMFSCSSIRPYYASKEKATWNNVELPKEGLQHTVYLIGDAGKGTKDMPHMKALGKAVDADDSSTTMVFLGDNIYPAGLPKKEDPERKAAEKYLNSQLEITRANKGSNYFIAGNHDWNYMRDGGFKALERQQNFVEKNGGSNTYFEPKAGCPGPKTVRLADGLVLILIDSQWWFHDLANDDLVNSDCKSDSKTEFIDRLKNKFIEHEDDLIIFANHHPFKTNGPHGGYFTFIDHVFPFTALNDKLFIPLPGLGSIHPIFRKVFGSRQDNSHPIYRAYINEIENGITQSNNGVVIASGHEHNLQFFNEGNKHYVVSGSGSKLNYVHRGGDALFAHQAKGYAKIYHYNNGAAYIEYYSANDDGTAVMNYRKVLTQPKLKVGKEANEEMASQVTTSVNERYRASRVKRYVLGRQYRKVYDAKITVPTLNLEVERGGLEILKLGGGQSTSSLRVADSSGKQFTIRSLDKNFNGLIPEELKNTIAEDLFADQVSANFPYGATTVPGMADAIGVYHTNPKYVFMPKQNKLGEYNTKIGNELYLFEERPDDEHKDLASFGKPDKIKGTTSMLEDLKENNENRVDQKAYLKARLFDILLNDWDRHGDQWRWSVFKGDKKNVYRPIPRDRDQTYYRFAGILPYFVSRKWGVRSFQNFKPKIRDLKGLNFSGYPIDNELLNKMTLPQYISSAKFIQQKLTDEVIAQSIKDGLPKEIFELEGQQIIKTLIARRNDLHKYAEEYFKDQAEIVNIVGSDERELFTIKTNEKGSTTVEVHDLNDGEKDELLYSRTLYKKYTNEIRIYGLDKDDQFVIEGYTAKAPTIRIVGGLGEDKYTDNSQNRGLCKNIHYYDMTEGNKIVSTKNTKVKLSDDPYHNLYDRKLEKYDTYMPSVILGFNEDLGFYYGGGIKWTNYNWKKTPFSNKHNISLQIGTKELAVQGEYNSEWTSVLGEKTGVGFNNEFIFPDYSTNYFGLTDTTSRTFDDDFYSYRKNSVKSYLNLIYTDKYRVNRINYGLLYNYNQAFADANSFINEQNQVINATDFDELHQIGPKVNYLIDKVNSLTNPTSGVRFNIGGQYLFDVNNLEDQTYSFKTDLTYYFSMKIFQKTTVASKFGYGQTGGDRKFYQNEYLGERNNFRGLLNERYSGKQAFYHNNDVRMSLFSVKGKIPFNLGLLGSFDYGKVWNKEIKKADLLHSYGGGIWLNFVDNAIVNCNYMISNDDKLFSAGLGFYF